MDAHTILGSARARGGPEMTPREQTEVVEILSAADPSVGWCAMIGSDAQSGSTAATACRAGGASAAGARTRTGWSAALR